MDKEKLAEVIKQAVDDVKVVDVHTHLFPSSHGDLMLFGIDELLNYHYIVSEYFMVAPSEMTTEKFFGELTHEQRADLIWEELFMKRSPISEACQGVLTVLKELGMTEGIRSRNLRNIRSWFNAQDPAEYAERVFKLAGVDYVVMTNIPFDDKEAIHWTNQTPYDKKRFKPALRVDPLLSADTEVLEKKVFARKVPNFDTVLPELRIWLEDWAKKMDPIYLFASSPRGFTYDPQSYLDNEGRPTSSYFIDKVLIPLAEKLKLPIGLKLGAARGVNPALNPVGGGDGIDDVCWLSLERLLRKYPQVKFLVTVLPREGQHRVCVLANKFRNLHLYGCWWYCNNPSIIEEITEMRLEMLGISFTAQHSDARVLDQLVYKWRHSRNVIARTLLRRYAALADTGWTITEAEIRRDVELLLGGAYKAFMAK